MNSKQLTILVMLGLVIGGAGLMLSKRDAASWNRTEGGIGKKVLGEFPINDVTRIVIRHGGAELRLFKDEIWKVQERSGYPANFAEIGDFLRKAAELKAVQTVKVGSSQLGRLELVSPETEKGTNGGTLVEFKDKDDKSIKSLLLGKKYVRESGGDAGMGGGYPVGRYVMVPGNPQSVSVVSEALTDIEPKAEHWLSKDWFKVEKLKSITVAAPAETNSWKIGRESESGSWSLLDKKAGEDIETNKLSSVGYALSSPSFNDVLSPEIKPETVGMDKPLVATLETFENFIYTVKIGGKTNDDNYPVNVSVTATISKERTPGKDEKPEDKEKLDKEFKDKAQKLEDKLKQEKSFEKWTYLVAKWTIDPLLKERKDFLAEKKDAKKDEKKEADSLPPLLPDLDEKK